MSRPKNEERHIIPSDWGSPHSFHGFTRDHNYHDYIVQIRVCKQTMQFARTKSALEAARIYDVALWKMNPFTPSCSKPNFPDSFSLITQADVDNSCPLANKFFEIARKQVEGAGVSLESLVKAKEQKLAILNVSLTEGASAEYSRLVKVVQEIQMQAATLNYKLSDRSARVGLTKFPQLCKGLEEVKRNLEALDSDARTLLVTFTEYTDLFKKYQSL